MLPGAVPEAGRGVTVEEEGRVGQWPRDVRFIREEEEDEEEEEEEEEEEGAFCSRVDAESANVARARLCL